VRYGGKKAKQSARSAVVLHGMLGQHKNLNALSSQLANTFTDFNIYGVTHRGHGESDRGESPFTVDSCAQDIIELSRKEFGGVPDVIIGHSFGGKVALAVTKTCVENNLRYPRETWILDATPGTWDDDMKKRDAVNGVSSVMSVIHDVKVPADSRASLSEDMTQHGLPPAIVQWMTTNMERKHGKMDWSFDLQVCEKLFDSYKKTDFWPFLDSEKLGATLNCEIHFMQAGKNPNWTPDILKRFRDCPNKNVEVVEVHGAGHWIHIDKADDVFELLLPSFLRGDS